MVDSRDYRERPRRPGVPSALSPSGKVRSRRNFLVTSSVVIAASGAAAIAATTVSSRNRDTYPIRPPAVPLVVRGPYASTWLPGTTLPGTSPTFWTGSRTEMTGIVRVDGIPYTFAGSPGFTGEVPDGDHGRRSRAVGSPRALGQSLLEITPTRSRFHLDGAGIRLLAEFLSPVHPDELPGYNG
jgi:hypothetical protein